MANAFDRQIFRIADQIIKDLGQQKSYLRQQMSIAQGSFALGSVTKVNNATRSMEVQDVYGNKGTVYPRNTYPQPTDAIAVIGSVVS